MTDSNLKTLKELEANASGFGVPIPMVNSERLRDEAKKWKERFRPTGLQKDKNFYGYDGIIDFINYFFNLEDKE